MVARDEVGFEELISNSSVPTLAAFLSMSWSLPRVPHQIPASLAWSLGWRLLRKWTRWVEIGSRTDSAGTWGTDQLRIKYSGSVERPMLFYGRRKMNYGGDVIFIDMAFIS